jgi:hypothetical protein
MLSKRHETLEGVFRCGLATVPFLHEMVFRPRGQTQTVKNAERALASLQRDKKLLTPDRPLGGGHDRGARPREGLCHD